MTNVAESLRLQELKASGTPWRFWGPYLSERQWGTVREDYSTNGDAWNYFSHDEARSRAYMWGEDGIAGVSDDQQNLCFCVALWNYKDPILKERLFGLTNSEGNHGEDVKEYYFYLDNTPTHSYMKYLYKYPQAAYPYSNLLDTNRSRSRLEMEYELINTGVFADNAYFDVEVEFAKASTTDLLISINVSNRGKQAAALVLLPQLWFRNTWIHTPSTTKPSLKRHPQSNSAILANHEALGEYALFCEGSPELVFTENDTNERRYTDPNWKGYAKDAFHHYLIQKEKDAINPQQTGTKSAAVYRLEVPAGQVVHTRLRLRKTTPGDKDPFADFDRVLAQRRSEADEFYDSISPSKLTADEKLIMRQALAGMLWSKQFYYLDNDLWLRQHGGKADRNQDWPHILSSDIISMPDKWEYPWYASWDLAFHTIPLAMVDIEFAKSQLHMLLSDVYLHGNGQLPAYEWNFSDVNPPVHGWATMHVVELEKARTGTHDVEFLKSIFHKLLLNFTWWINRKDNEDRNVFEGGFLGLDNIGIFDRSSPLPGGGSLDQADGTAWMALFSQNMLQIALELTRDEPVYAEMATKFLEHFLRIAAAMETMGPHCASMWDDNDGFYYDVMRTPDGHSTRLCLRSMVGLLPLCATTVLEEEVLTLNPDSLSRVRKFMARHPELLANIALPNKPGYKNRRLLAIVNEDRLRRILRRMLDENEFFSPHGIRAVSKIYGDHPYHTNIAGQDFFVKYLPAESDTGMFGGNSNWRGPVWMPVNFMILRSLHQFYLYYGNDFKVECPTGSGNMLTLFEVAAELGKRLRTIFMRDSDGKRPVFGGTDYFNNDPYWRDCLLFYEYFHGDNGAGIGASHQTGWTGLTARLFQLHGVLTPESALDGSNVQEAVVASMKPSR
jgi:hypothetical protein